MTWVLRLIVLFGIALRFVNVFDDPSLWLDEVFSAKLAESPLGDLLMAVPRFDTHPPLYYLQLHVWSLLGEGDRWLLLNSVLLDVMVILSLLWVVGRLRGGQSGLWVAAVYAVLPLNVFFAHNLRMYALFFLLVVWLWYLLERRVIDGGATRGARIGTLLLGLGATLTHGLGFFVVFFVYFQALVRGLQGHRPGDARLARQIGLDYVPVALAALYSLGIGSFRQTEGIEAFDLEIIGIHLTISLFGMEVPLPSVTGYLGLVMLLVPPALSRQSRPVLFWLVLLPFATLLVLSLTVKTVFMYRTLGLFSPFLAMALGVFFAEGWQARRAVVQGLSGAVLAILVVASINTTLSFRKAGYRDIAAIWTSRSPDNAVLFVDGPVNLWGMARYIDAAPSFSALDIQPPVRDGLKRIKDRLDGSFLDRAGLFGVADHLVIGGRELWPYVAEQRLATLDRYWVLSLGQAACLHPQDTNVQTFTATGQTLQECRRAPP
ncbi:MAG: glycosyltransferase family 39 protein [Rhodobacteraceae bacterium]|nr:glycosyltransferase family 39 protein [Paracoccaceae bacterium]